MVYKTLEITLISAKDLKNVNLIGKMDPYVVVHLSDEPKNKQKTPVHQDGGTKPSWNYTMRFSFDDAAATKPGKYLILTLKHDQAFGSDKDLGEVVVPFKELLEGVKDPSSPQFVTYQVRRVSSGKAQGELKMSYKIMDMGHDLKPAQSSCSSSAAVPYPPPGGHATVYPPPHQQAYPPPHQHAYPPPHQQGAAVYPPPHSQELPPPVAAGVPYPPPQGYPPQSPGTGVPYAAGPPQGYPPYGGYPPPPHAGAGYGYGYPQQGGYPVYPPAGYAQKQQKPKKNNNFGMGLGAGLLGGAIGGLVLGEMVDDAFDVDCDF